MKLLAIESATLEVGAAIVDDGRIVASSAARPGRRHAETLHPAIGRVLEAAHTSASELDAIAVDVGPGLFTGLRVGVAAAKAIAFAVTVPVVAVTSTEALRAMAKDLFADAMAICAVVDMRRGEVAWERDGGSLQVGSAQALVAFVAAAGEVRLVGDGTLRLPDELFSASTVHVERAEVLWAPSVEAVGRIGTERAVSSDFTDSDSLVPVYLRPPDAVANFATRAASGVGEWR